jgi:hypothetical protein
MDGLEMRQVESARHWVTRHFIRPNYGESRLGLIKLDLVCDPEPIPENSRMRVNVRILCVRRILRHVFTPRAIKKNAGSLGRHFAEIPCGDSPSGTLKHFFDCHLAANDLAQLGKSSGVRLKAFEALVTNRDVQGTLTIAQRRVKLHGCLRNADVYILPQRRERSQHGDRGRTGAKDVMQLRGLSDVFPAGDRKLVAPGTATLFRRKPARRLAAPAPGFPGLRMAILGLNRRPLLAHRCICGTRLRRAGRPVCGVDFLRGYGVFAHRLDDDLESFGSPSDLQMVALLLKFLNLRFDFRKCFVHVISRVRR